MSPSSADIDGAATEKAESTACVKPETSRGADAGKAGSQQRKPSSDGPNDSVPVARHDCKISSAMVHPVPHCEKPGTVQTKKMLSEKAPKAVPDVRAILSTSASQKAAVPARIGHGFSLNAATFSASPTPIDVGVPVFVPTMKGTSKKQTPTERLQRSRERNRMHARKTRQRKKEHIQTLQNRADQLKQEQIRLRQVVNEKNTANILVGLFSQGSAKSTEDPRIEQLLLRPVEAIPDASKIPELPALILPGQHNSKKNKAASAAALRSSSVVNQDAFPDDGIDYELLGKDRSQCSPEELDQIRRERNRMHAKRTRDRKRLFMEEMEELIKKLECENKLLKEHAEKLNADQGGCSEEITSSLVSPDLKPSTPALLEVPPTITRPSPVSAEKQPRECREHQRNVEVEKIKSLLAAAGAFEESQQGLPGMLAISSAASVVSATHSAAGSVADDDQGEYLSHGSSSPRPSKRQRLEVPTSPAPSIVSAVPTSITTVGC